MSINLVRRQYGGTPQHPTLFGVEFSRSPDVIYWLKSTSIPERVIGHGEIPWMNGLYHYVTRTTGAGTWDCTFYVFEDMAPMKWLYEWYEATFDHRTGKFGRRSDYSLDATVFLMDSTTETRTIEFTMHHVMLTRIGSVGTFDFNSDANPEVRAEFIFEDFDIAFNTPNGLGG